MHLNSHIYTQIVSLKLRNRDNKLYRILKASFRKVKIEDFKRYSGKPSIFSHKLKNNLPTISSMFNRKKSESLTSLVFDFFPDIKPEQRQSQASLPLPLPGAYRRPNSASSPIRACAAAQQRCSAVAQERSSAGAPYRRAALSKEHPCFAGSPLTGYPGLVGKQLAKGAASLEGALLCRAHNNGSKGSLARGCSAKGLGEESPSYAKGDNDITRYIIKFIKHIKLRGIRVEAKGRLTRPRTAARSVFKMRYLGGLKKYEFIGLSQRMLRGDKKDNVSYSLINSNGRNGSFGVKG